MKKSFFTFLLLSYTVFCFSNNLATATISENFSMPATATFTVSATDVTCNGSADGTATVNISSGNPPYTYTWSSGISSATNTANNIPVGNYTVQVTDATNTISSSFSISEPFAIINVMTVTNATAAGNDGSINTSTTGGVPPYSYSWSNGLAGAANQSNLAAGTYCVTVSDANACSAVDCGTVNQTAPLTVGKTIIYDFCNGGCNGSILVGPSGGISPYSFNWSTGATSVGSTGTVSNLCAGTYSTTVTDAVGSTLVTVSTINQPSPIITNSTIINVSSVGASDGAINLNVTGGVSPYQFNWTNGLPPTSSQTGLIAGIYCYTVTDANACTNTGCDSVLTSGTVGIQSRDVDEFILSIFPNPSNGLLSIELKSIAKNTLVQVLDLNGKVILEIEATSNYLNLDLTGYSNGIYFLKAGAETKKLILNK